MFGMKLKILCFIVLANLKNLECSSKVWMPDLNIQNPANWVNEELPCPQQSFIFPNKLNSLILLPVTMNIEKLVFPGNGGIMFPDTDAEVLIKKQNHITAECKQRRGDALFKTPVQSPFYSTQNWGRFDEIKRKIIKPNKAVPHAEMIPCQFDRVIFPKNASIRVDFQYIPKIVLKEILLNDRLNDGDLEEFKNLLSQEVGQLMFPNNEETQIKQGTCIDPNKCSCQNADILETICENHICEVPHCIDPISVIGHCCPVCGSVFTMDLSRDPNFDFEKFREKLKRGIVASEIDVNEVDYHVSLAHHFLQLVIVDKNDYNEKSVTLMKILEQSVLKQLFKDKQKVFKSSGIPYAPNESGHTLLFIFASLLIVTTFLMFNYLYYYEDKTMPRLRAMIRNRNLFTSPFVFARFDPKNENEETIVDIDFGTESVENLNSSFNNPMFEESLKGKDKTDETNFEEGESSSYSNVELESAE